MASNVARRNSTRNAAPSRRTRVDAELVSERILEAFSAKAKRVGLRALMMTDLATELQMSATTLYKLYPSKEALALACVGRWADELGAAAAAKQTAKAKRDGFEQYLHWIDAWADANAALSPAFSRDLQTEYPAVWKRYRAVVDERKQIGADLLRPLLKPGINEAVAFAMLNAIFTIVLQPDFADNLQVSRRDALRVAVGIWAGGALARASQGKLRRVRDAKTTKR
jgi:AcrR family transcriptional regulator